VKWISLLTTDQEFSIKVLEEKPKEKSFRVVYVNEFLRVM